MKNLPDFIANKMQSTHLTSLTNHYQNKDIIVTGGASFIGSNLVDTLVSLGAHVRILDDFSSGKQSNIQNHKNIEVINSDLRYREQVERDLTDCDGIFHLAAIHGGRGFIEQFKGALLDNFAVDSNVFMVARNRKIQTIVHASSACAYPVNLQSSSEKLNYLRENQASLDLPETSFADGVYGWTKLIGEYQLENSVSDSMAVGRSARIFTAYGERENESHAAIALIAKALLGANPYPIWGNGQQTRNFTYVSDTVTGLLFLGASNKIGKQFESFNVGNSTHTRVIEFVNEIFRQLDVEAPPYKFELDKPMGVASRASQNDKMRAFFDWAPDVDITQGIDRTMSWYRNLKDRPNTLEALEERLLAR